MMISTKGRYALRVMLELAGQPEGEYISLKAVSENQEISAKYLEAIVAVLVKADLVESIRGKGGGYRLNRPAGAYSVGEILRAAEGSLAPVSCLEDGNDCEKAKDCLTRPLWQKLELLVSDYLDRVSLKDLMEQEI